MDSNTRTLLHECSYSNQHGAFFAEQLIKLGADVHAPTNEGYSPLQEAICNGNSDVARLLLSKGANLDDTDSDGCGILGSVLSSCSVNALKGLRFVLEKGWTDYVVHKSRGLGALHMGVCFVDKIHDSATHREIIDLLLFFFKAHVNVVDGAGRTPLHLAAAAGDPYALEALLKHGANLAIADSHGDTALDVAMELAKAEPRAIFKARKPALIDPKQRLATLNFPEGEDMDLNQSEFEELLVEEYGVEFYCTKRRKLVEILETWSRKNFM